MSDAPPDTGSQLVAAGATLVKVTHEAMQAVSIQRPRDLEAINLAIITEIDRVQEWAIRGFYRRKISQTEYATGPSVYLTRIVARNFGNCSVRSYLSSQTDEIYQLAGVFLDLETNVLFERMQPVSVLSWRRGPEGGSGYYETLSGEKLSTALVAGSSKAERNAVAAGVPDWIMQAAFKKCRKLAADDTKKRLSSMITVFASLGVSREQLDRHFDGKNLEKLDDDQYADLRGLATGVQDGDISASEIGRVEGEAQAETESDTSTVEAVIGDGASSPKGDELADKLKASLKPSPDTAEEPVPAETGGGADVVPIAGKKNRPPVGF